MRVSLIVAAAENDVIGRDGRLPWHLPDDLRRFKRMTWGKPVLMGRRTHESIGRALPGRTNLVLTRQAGRLGRDCIAVADLAEAFERAGGADELMVIGGAAVYRATLAVATRLYLTRVHVNADGDTRFPDYDAADWRIVEREHHPPDSAHAYPFTFLTLERVAWPTG